MNKTETVPAFLVACMDCHSGKPEVYYTMEEAQKVAYIHLSCTHRGHKDHSGHEVTITPTQVVRQNTSKSVPEGGK